MTQEVIVREMNGTVGTECRAFYTPWLEMISRDMPFVELFLPAGSRREERFDLLEEAGDLVVSRFSDKGKGIYKLVLTTNCIEIYKSPEISWFKVQELLQDILEEHPETESVEFIYATSSAGIRTPARSAR